MMRGRRLLPFAGSLFAAATLLLAVLVVVAPAFAEPSYLPAEPEARKAPAAAAPEVAEVPTPAAPQAPQSRSVPAPPAPVGTLSACDVEVQLGMPCQAQTPPAESERAEPVEAALREPSPDEIGSQSPCRQIQANMLTTNAQTHNDDVGLQQLNQLNHVQNQRNANLNLQQCQINVVQTNQQQVQVNALMINDAMINDRSQIQHGFADQASHLRERALSMLERAESFINTGRYDRARSSLASVEFHAQLLESLRQPTGDLRVRAAYLAEQAELFEHALVVGVE